ncbi:MAG TPA: flagellar hook-basal body complex protein FliE [Clostridiaceae bacterium]|nr:flagellar hook-basal body complex protein FliE [Clostridiaceae bacterium]HHV99036.1 flagellar hook-basal body complex protein FliE [Clostridiaceae bacterium]
MSGVYGLSGNKSVNGEITFSDFLKNELDKANDLIIQSDQLSEDFAAGKTDNIHQVLIAVEKADIALQLTLQIRNKLMDAYNEIMRMQL